MNLDLDGTYRESTLSGTSRETANQLHGFGQYNHLFTDRFYGDLRVEGLRDRIADINYRMTLSAGGGYYFIKTTNDTLRGELGPGYIFEEDHGVPNSTTRTYSGVRGMPYRRAPAA